MPAQGAVLHLGPGTGARGPGFAGAWGSRPAPTVRSLRPGHGALYEPGACAGEGDDPRRSLDIGGSSLLRASKYQTSRDQSLWAFTAHLHPPPHTHTRVRSPPHTHSQLLWGYSLAQAEPPLLRPRAPHQPPPAEARSRAAAVGTSVSGPGRVKNQRTTFQDPTPSLGMVVFKPRL